MMRNCLKWNDEIIETYVFIKSVEYIDSKQSSFGFC